MLMTESSKSEKPEIHNAACMHLSGPLMIEDGLIAFNHASASNELNWYFVITLPGFCCMK